MEEDNRQEWTFTLYGFDNSGKATREVMHLCLQKTVHWAGSWQQTDARALVSVMRRQAKPSRVGGEAGPSPGMGAAVTRAATGAQGASWPRLLALFPAEPVSASP